MATVVSLNKDAPENAGTVRFSFGNEEFSLEEGKTLTLDPDTDPAVVSSVASHPWLDVEVTTDESPPSEAIEPEVAEVEPLFEEDKA